MPNTDIHQNSPMSSPTARRFGQPIPAADVADHPVAAPAGRQRPRRRRTIRVASLAWAVALVPALALIPTATAKNADQTGPEAQTDVRINHYERAFSSAAPAITAAFSGISSQPAVNTLTIIIWSPPPPPPHKTPGAQHDKPAIDADIAADTDPLTAARQAANEKHWELAEHEFLIALKSDGHDQSIVLAELAKLYIAAAEHHWRRGLLWEQRRWFHHAKDQFDAIRQADQKSPMLNARSRRALFQAVAEIERSGNQAIQNYLAEAQKLADRADNTSFWLFSTTLWNQWSQFMSSPNRGDAVWRPDLTVADLVPTTGSVLGPTIGTSVEIVVDQVVGVIEKRNRFVEYRRGLRVEALRHVLAAEAYHRSFQDEALVRRLAAMHQKLKSDLPGDVYKDVTNAANALSNQTSD